MYDCIVMASGTLPPGVELIEVLEEAAEEAVTEVVASMPRKGDTLSAQDMVAAGGTPALMIHIAMFRDCDYTLTNASQAPSPCRGASPGNVLRGHTGLCYI